MTITKLIEAVERGEATMDEFDAVFPPDGKPFKKAPKSIASIDAGLAFHGNIDAAKRLHDALLPGWALERLTMWPGSNGQCTAHIWGTHHKDGERWHHHSDGRQEAASSTPARAWLLAILRALEATQEPTP